MSFELLKEIEREIQQEKMTLVDRVVRDILGNYVFDEKNVSPNLITMLMSAAQSSKLPVPEGKEIPQGAQDAAEDILDFLNINTSSIYTDLIVSNNVYLYGKAGSGKTTLAKKIATVLLKRPSYTINCNQFTSPVQIIGGQTIEGYKEGNLVKAWREGGVLILDELPKLDPNTAGLLNEALAASADNETKIPISKEKYTALETEMLAEGKYLGYEVVEDGDKYYQIIHVTITDGKGDKVRKHKNFCCIGTGNTDMKTVSTNYSGNNRQDYSLVDRFAGSFYKIDYDITLERKLTYERVYMVSTIIREFLNKDSSSVEFISLRTMLNFNRIYEQEMLREIESPFAKGVFVVGSASSSNKGGKTFGESVSSFIDTLPETKRVALRAETNIDKELTLDTDPEIFIQEFIRLHGVHPITEEIITK